MEMAMEICTIFNSFAEELISAEIQEGIETNRRLSKTSGRGSNGGSDLR
jgi:hypothetical protein